MELIDSRGATVVSSPDTINLPAACHLPNLSIANCVLSMPDASVHLCLQLCTEEIWQGTMEQITKLDIQPAELPEEALTQIYQVTDTCLQSYAT